MEKSTQNINKNILVHLTNDAADDSEFKLKLQSLDARVQKMLLWSTICSLWSYSILFVVIARIYPVYIGIHSFMLITSTVLIYLLMGVPVYQLWKGIHYKRSYYYCTRKSHLNYQDGQLSVQRKFIILYLLLYTLLLAAVSLFFLSALGGLILLLKITTAVNIITYASGLYFIANFTKLLKQLQCLHRQLNQLYIQNFNSN
jgi:hypothetical protein